MAVRTIKVSNEVMYQFYEADPCNQVNPLEYFKEQFTEMFYRMELLKLEPAAKTFSQRVNAKSRARIIANNECSRRLAQIEQIEVQDIVKNLFLTKKKKAQQKLVQELRMNTDSWVSIPLFAWQNLGLAYTSVISDKLPKDLENKVLPHYMNKLDNGRIEYHGYTDMSVAEMHKAIETRRRIISMLIGDESNWYCFFRTMDGIQGREEKHQGEPHAHFISSAWGLSRDEVIRELSSYRYSLRSDSVPFDKRQRSTNESKHV